MKKLFKSVIAALSIALTLSLAFSAAACSFGAKEYVPSDDSYFEFVLNQEGTAYSVKAASVSNLPDVLKLPEEHNGKPVDSVADNGFEKADITGVQLPLSIKKVGKNAFADCKKLSDLYFFKGQGLEEIGSGAFSNNTSLVDLVCPNTLKKVDNSAFWGCNKLERVKLPEKVETIGDYAFAYCTGLTYFYVPTKTSQIGDNAFLGSNNVKIEISPSNPYYFLNNGKLFRVA